MTLYLFLIFIVLIFGGIAYLMMRFFNRWTRNSRYETIWDTLIFIGSFALVLLVAGFIFFYNLNLGR